MEKRILEKLSFASKSGEIPHSWPPCKPHHHHHLSRSCHCWQMASTTCAMHFDPGPFSSIDCQRLPRCHLSISFWVFLLVVFHLWVSTLMLFSPTWCSSFWLHVLPTVLSCTSLFLLYLSPLFSILLSRSWSCKPIGDKFKFLGSWFSK